MLKKLWFIIPLLLTIPGMAAGQAPANFKTQKDRLLKDVENRLGSLQKVRDCIKGAQDHTALKTCRDNMKKQWQEAREAPQKQWQNTKNRQKKRVEDAKAKGRNELNKVKSLLGH